MSICGFYVLLKDNQEKGGENEITEFFLATNLEDLTFEKLDLKKKYKTQEKVGCGRKNEVHVDETRN